MPTKLKTLDIRPLLARGEEPFPIIREQANRLSPGQGLTVIAPFLPAPLIEYLKGEGFQSAPKHRADGAWSVNFWKE